MYIDYDNSLLSLVSSVLKHYKVDTAHPTLPEADGLLKGNYKNVVVMLFDEMGTAILEKHLRPDSFLRSHLERTISSVFPPTTTAATVTMETRNKSLTAISSEPERRIREASALSATVSLLRRET